MGEVRQAMRLFTLLDTNKQLNEEKKQNRGQKDYRGVKVTDNSEPYAKNCVHRRVRCQWLVKRDIWKTEIGENEDSRL